MDSIALDYNKINTTNSTPRFVADVSSPRPVTSHLVAPSLLSNLSHYRATRHCPRAKYSNITNVAYPPIYEKFLSIIGVFNLDLAWILSAACLTTNVNFYHKLL